MSFDPQSILPLPKRPNLEFYRKRAKKMALSEKCLLTRAQFQIARSYGFESWPKFSKHLLALAKSSPVSRFEAAADAIVDGDEAVLKKLLLEDPKLVRTRSNREHGATLLHYVSANGVEYYRQKTPKNIVAITELLLDAGAEVDATANVYGGKLTTLDLAATSIFPVRAGVLEQLLQLLLDRGAKIELASVNGCLGNGRPQAAAFLAARGARLDVAGAAGVGRLDAVQRLIENASKEKIGEGLFYASEYGHNDVVRFLLERGADLAWSRKDGQTPLHGAVIGGHLETVRLLLKHRPPLEVANAYGGTAFGQALWSAAHGGDTETYIAILEALAEAGAKIPERHVPVNARVDVWLAERGSVSEPKWHWFGEKP